MSTSITRKSMKEDIEHVVNLAAKNKDSLGKNISFS